VTILIRDDGSKGAPCGSPCAQPSAQRATSSTAIAELSTSVLQGHVLISRTYSGSGETPRKTCFFHPTGI
jgi:hypothetical protein